MIANAACPGRSISRRLSAKLATLIFVGLALTSGCIYWALSSRVQSLQQDSLAEKQQVLAGVMTLAATKGEAEVVAKLDMIAPMRGGVRLQVHRGDGSLLHADPDAAPFVLSPHRLPSRFEVASPRSPGGRLVVDAAMDIGPDTRMLRGFALTLAGLTLLAAACVGALVYWRVRGELKPLASLATQVSAISADRLDQRLALPAEAASELAPWITQFNALMERLERAMAQLEAFNADVAHELRTPLATLIGETEVTLARERSPEVLRDTLVSNLEEMQRLSALVNDMLFLASADRGACARRGEPVSLAALAHEVAEFHEAAFEEAQLKLQIEGDATLAVDAPLFKRAVSNLLGNAARFAKAGSTVHLAIAPDEPDHVRIEVRNAGEPIEPTHLPRLFDRFFRAEPSRCCPETGEQHHGLGLAIVAAIARMHAGRTLADCAGGTTRVGFTLATR
jgi:two-component system heavy metal sensor histidine kinase CusS